MSDTVFSLFQSPWLRHYADVAILFHPKPGTLLLCDYRGHTPPEMVKTRPVLIVSPRSRVNGLVTVVALSTSVPETILPWHHRITLETPLSPAWPACDVWAKCDMLNTFHVSRLDRFHARIENKRKYYDRRIPDADLDAVRKCIAAFFGL